MKIVSLSGLVPEQIIDVVRFEGFVGDRNISHYCGYASDFISLANRDKNVDGIVFPRTCDSCRILSSYLDRKDLFYHHINMPVNKGDCSVDYLASEIKRFKLHVEEHFKISIKNEDIVKRIRLINKRNNDLLSLYNNLNHISYSDYLAHIHDLLVKPLSEQVVKIDFSNHSGKLNGYLVGSFLANTNVVRIIEKQGVSIVGDNLPESGRLVSTPPVSESGDLFHEIAKSMIIQRGSPSLSNYIPLIERDIEEIKTKKVNAVFFVIQKYCEPYEYLYSIYKKRLDALNIPSLKIQLTDSTDENKVELLVGAFVDSLK